MFTWKSIAGGLILLISLGGCASYDYPVALSTGDKMLSVTAQNLEGDTVNIGWNAEDCRALDPSD